MLDTILTVGHRLSHDEVLFLSERLEPKSRQRQRRLETRDAAVREGWSHFAHLGRTVAARHLERALSLYLATRWHSDRKLAELPPDADPLRRALYLVASFNDGDTLGWRQMLNVIDGHRGDCRN